MKIVVVLRLEPVLTEELELTEDSRDIDKEWIGLELNQFDDQALEQAVLIKESQGAHVTALAIEDEGTDRLLKTALARGADEVLQISVDDEGLESRSSRAMSPIYAEALREINPDLVLVGVVSTADLYGELSPYLGAHMGWPQVSAVSDVQTNDSSIIVQQEYAGGRAVRIEVSMPAVVGLQTATQPPRYVAGSKLRELLKVEIPTTDTSSQPMGDLSLNSVLELPDLSEGAEMFEGATDSVVDQIYSLLQDRGLA